jgi:dienelactone hydrolase
VTDPIIATAIKYIRTKLGVSRIVATGYCFGGRYAFRFVDAGKGVSVAYAAHPSLLESSEIQAIDGPVSVAAADNDSLFTAALRNEMEALLVKIPQPYQVSLYSGTEHGFAVRANLSDPEQKFAKEEAFLQAVRWFDHFL